jgi:hypothetical protein
MKMWLKWVDWRINYRPDKIKKHDIKDSSLTKYFRIHKQDKDGNPLVILAPGFTEDDYDIDTFTMVCIHLAEKVMKKADKNREGKITVIFDRAQMTQSKDKKWFPLYKLMAQIFQDYYPERLKVAYVVNANWFTKMVISMVKVFLSQSTKDKI